MDYVLLSPEEAAALLSLSAQEVVGLIESGELGGLKVAGHWKVPLKSITQMLAGGMKHQTARALEQVFEDHETWRRVFGAHPEVTQQLEAGEFPVGSVGAYLKEAIAFSRGQQQGRTGPGSTDPSLQDDDYQEGDEDGERRA
jgi:excisionase family DNA binding protein